MPNMQHFFVTFGNKYRSEMHPQGMHPDGWCRIVASDYTEAMRKAWDAFGRNFCRVQTGVEFVKSFYPKGELKLIL